MQPEKEVCLEKEVYKEAYPKQEVLASQAADTKPKSLWAWTLDALFPRRCPICDGLAPKGLLACPDCVRLLQRIEAPTCMKCGKALRAMEEELCPNCRKRRFSFAYGVCLYHYDGVTAASMARIKYHGRREYLDFYGKESARLAGAQLANMHVEALVPVPVHRSRLKQRGYNQAEVLAEVLGRELDIPVLADALCRRKKTAALKTMGAGERLKSLCNAFYAGALPPELKSVCLVDDIFTTGATMEACARALKAAGVERVYCFSLCTGGG